MLLGLSVLNWPQSIAFIIILVLVCLYLGQCFTCTPSENRENKKNLDRHLDRWLDIEEEEYDKPIPQKPTPPEIITTTNITRRLI